MSSKTLLVQYEGYGYRVNVSAQKMGALDAMIVRGGRIVLTDGLIPFNGSLLKGLVTAKMVYITPYGDDSNSRVLYVTGFGYAAHEQYNALEEKQTAHIDRNNQKQTPSPDVSYLTIKQIAERLGVDRKTINSRVLRGEIPAIWHNGQWLIKRADFAAWRDSVRIKPYRGRKEIS